MALDDPDGGTPILEMASPNLSEMRPIWSGAAPKRCLIRMIDIEEVKTPNGSELRASFRNPGLVQDLPAGGIEQAIRDAVRDAGPAQGFVARTRLRLAQAKVFIVGTVLSPLDIELVGDPTIVAFILAKPANLQFSPLVKALSHKNPADREGYGGLTHVSLENGIYYESAAPLEDCRIVYFVAAPPPASSDPPPPTYSYKHGLNINVRLNHPSDDNGIRRALDLTIDPDIRYPGQ